MAITINVNLDEILAALKDDLDFTGNADKYIKVNATADGFEFAAVTAPTWGAITGTLSSQTDLQSALDAKANLSGAAFTGDVSVTTSGSGDTLQLTNSGSGTTLNIANSGSGDFLVIDTDKLVVSNNGNLAVDTNTLFVDAVNNRVGFNIAPLTNLHLKNNASSLDTIFRIQSNDRTVNFSLFNAPNVFEIDAAITRFKAQGAYPLYIANAGVSVGFASTPSALLHVKTASTSTIGAIIQAAAGQTANLLDILNSSSQKLLSVEADQNSRFRVYNSDGSQNTMVSFNKLNMYTSRFIVQAGINSTAIFPNSGELIFLIAGSNTRATYFRFTNDGPRYLGASSGSQDMILIDPNVNQSSTAGYNMIRVNPTHTSVGSGDKFLTWLGVGGTEKFAVESDGTIRTNGNAGFTGTGSYTNFTIENGIITAAS